MQQVEYAARLLEIEATVQLSRSAMLRQSQDKSLKYLLEVRKLLNELCVNILSPDETKIYLAK